MFFSRECSFISVKKRTELYMLRSYSRNDIGRQGGNYFLSVVFFIVT